jgi:hypothetical protein
LRWFLVLPADHQPPSFAAHNNQEAREISTFYMDFSNLENSSEGERMKISTRIGYQGAATAFRLSAQTKNVTLFPNPPT